VKNTQHTFNRWFIPQEQADCYINKLGGKEFVNVLQLDEIDRMEVVQPCLIYAAIPHDVYTEDQAVFPRIGLQCQLFNEPEKL
jgi:hypothetical protein